MSAPAEHLDPHWLAAAFPGRIACSRNGTTIDLGIDAPLDDLAAVVHLLATGPAAEAVAAQAGTSVEDAERALGVLREHGALAAGAPAPAPSEGIPLAEAILRAGQGESFTIAWTAEEALVLPADAGPEVRRRAVRWFVAGLADDARVAAYGGVAGRRLRSVAGDVPDAGALADALARARAADQRTVRVAATGEEAVATLDPARLDRIGVDEPHRLGPLRSVRAVDCGPPLAGRRHAAIAEYAVGNLASPLPRSSRVGRGTTASAAESERLARAEAAERFGLTDVDPARLRRASAGELPAHVAPDRLHRWSERQYAAHPGVKPYDPAQELLWIEGRTPAGAATWVPATAVHLGLTDPDAPPVLVASSSGGAAGHDAADAGERAVRELIERDALVWTWAQRVSRERIDASGLPADAAELARAVERMGFAVTLVNLTLETKPVVMAVLHSDERVHIATACRDDPAAAAAKALDEAALVLSTELPRRPPALRPQEVVSPEDHMRLYLVPEHAARARFLVESPELIELGDVAAIPEPATEAVRAIGEPVIVDLTSPRTGPFHVARALGPDLLPISYGWDREPLGMPRLGRPRTTHDGRRLGREEAMGDTSIMPHPFP